MHTRLVHLRESYLHLTQEEVAKRINLTRSAVGNYEKGYRNMSDKVLADFCREFDVNEEWLRYGTGPIFRVLSSEEQLTNYYNTLLALPDDDFKKRFTLYIAKMEQPQWDALEKFLNDFTAENI